MIDTTTVMTHSCITHQVTLILLVSVLDIPINPETKCPSYLKLLQLLLDGLHLRAHYALCAQPILGPSQQPLQLSHKSVEVLDPSGSVVNLVQPGLTAFTQLPEKDMSVNGLFWDFRTIIVYLFLN